MDQLRNSQGFLSWGWARGGGLYFHGFYLQESHQVLQEKICEDPLESLVGGQEKNGSRHNLQRRLEDKRTKKVAILKQGRKKNSF